jgi:purine nucleosidase
MESQCKNRIIIDTDPGIDDALAILLAISSPELEVEALSVVGGNCSADQGVINALSILDLAGVSNIPVMKGLDITPFSDMHEASGSSVHGKDGLGHAVLPKPSKMPSEIFAVDGLIQCILENPYEITVVALAPLTNLAAALQKEPHIVKLVKEVIIMGGAFNTHGNNENRVAECNIYNDPLAAKAIFDSGMPITLVPLDVTRKALLNEIHILEMRDLLKGSPFIEFFNAAIQSYFKFHSWDEESKSCVLHDPLAMALTINRDLVKTTDLMVNVELSNLDLLGKTIGTWPRMSAETSNHIKVALDVRSTEFIELFVRRLTNFFAISSSSLP